MNLGKKMYQTMRHQESALEKLEMKLRIAEATLKIEQEKTRQQDREIKIVSAHNRVLSKKLKVIEAERQRDSDRELNRMGRQMMGGSGKRQRKKTEVMPDVPEPVIETVPEGDGLDESKLDEILDQEFGASTPTKERL